jgi:hypothetical protein
MRSRSDLRPLADASELRAYPPPAALDDATEAIASSLRRDPTDTSRTARDRLAALDAQDRATVLGRTASRLDPTERPRVASAATSADSEPNLAVPEDERTGLAPEVPSEAVGSDVGGGLPGAAPTGPVATEPEPPNPLARAPSRDVGGSAPAPGGGGNIEAAAITAPTVVEPPGPTAAPVVEPPPTDAAFPRLADLLQTAGPAPVPTFETTAPTGPVDVSALVSALAAGIAAAEASMRQQADAAGRRLNGLVAAARGRVRAEVTRADRVVE